jgi:hypothetical protein
MFALVRQTYATFSNKGETGYIQPFMTQDNDFFLQIPYNFVQVNLLA